MLTIGFSSEDKTIQVLPPTIIGATTETSPNNDGCSGAITEKTPIACGTEKLKWFDVDREETGSQVEYKDGSAEVLGFDEDDAGTRADYDFYADEDTGWAKNDKEVIYAMKKGLELIVTGVSSKGTTVIDTYTLKGFTAGSKKLNDEC